MRAKPSIKRRLQIAVLLPTITALVAISTVFLVHHWRTSHRANMQRLRTLAQLVAETIAPTLAFGDREDARQLLAALHAEDSILQAVLYDEAGESFAEYKHRAVAIPSLEAMRIEGVQTQRGSLQLLVPVEQGGKRYGTLYLRWDLRPLFSDMRMYVIGVLAVLAGSVVGALFISRILQKSISQPMLDLAQTARTVAEMKDYSVRARDSDTRELSTFSSVFNHMLEEIQLNQARLAVEIRATRQAEQALRSSEEQLRLITDATPALISYIDPDRRYRFANEQYVRWFGRPLKEIIGKAVADVVGLKTFESLRSPMERALGGERLRFEVEAPHSDGTVRWTNVDYIPHRSKDGLVLGLVVLALDISERKQTERALAQAHADLETQNQKLERTVSDRTAKLQEAVEELEAFSYSIAHDMRAPLRSMQGFSRLLLDEHAGELSTEGHAFLSRIISSADRLDRLIQDVLDYSKVVRADLRLERVPLHTLLDGILATYPHLQPPRACVTIVGKLPDVCGNQAALTQVFSNLLGNAVKFVKPDVLPTVKVYAEPTVWPGTTSADAAKRIRVWVEDNGIGIAKDAQARLFGMFQRLNRPELFEGTGIGLAIVRKAVERMGGTVGVESEEGQGSRFWVDLKQQ